MRHVVGGHGGPRPTRDEEPGVRGEREAAALALAAASCAARDRPEVASEQPPAPFIRAAPPPFPGSSSGSRGASEVSALPIPGPGLLGEAETAAPGPASPPAPDPRTPSGDAGHRLWAAPAGWAWRRPVRAAWTRGSRPAGGGLRGSRRACGAPRCAGLRLGATILCEGMPVFARLRRGPVRSCGLPPPPLALSPPGCLACELIALAWGDADSGRCGTSAFRLGSPDQVASRDALTAFLYL